MVKNHRQKKKSLKYKNRHEEHLPGKTAFCKGGLDEAFSLAATSGIHEKKIYAET